MQPHPTHLSFIRAALRPLAAGLASLALTASLHCATAPLAAPETTDLSSKPPARFVGETQAPALTVVPEGETATKAVPSCGASARSANHSPCVSVCF